MPVDGVRSAQHDALEDPVTVGCVDLPLDGSAAMRRRDVTTVIPLALGGLVLGGCSTATDSAPPPSTGTTPAGPPSASGSTASATPSPTLTPTPTPTPSPTAPPLPTVLSEWSLPALMRKKFPGSRIRRVRLQQDLGRYQRWEVSYRSGDLTVTGILLVPDGKGPFPAIVLNHGHIERSRYWSGQGVPREQDYLARQGFVVLHTDYRGHAGADDTSELDHTLGLGYAEDAINAAQSLKSEPSVDPDRVVMLGRSMGGAVTLSAVVVAPTVVRAAVVYASTSSLFLDNFRRWDLPERAGSANEVYRRFGEPDDEPEFYRDLSPRTYFDRVKVPILAHHGTRDDSCPIAWARATDKALKAADRSTELQVYEGEGHTFEPRWTTSIERSVTFLRRQLDA